MRNPSSSFQTYVFGAVSDQDRLTTYHDIIRSRFAGIVEQVLDEYGLSEQLERNKTLAQPIQILDAGCAEGLYLHDVATVLEARQLLKAAELNGLDSDVASLSTAEAYSRVSNPPRPHLKFYLHDLNQPLAKCEALQLENKLKFDFIYALRTVAYLPNPSLVVQQLFNALKPGGLLCLYDIVSVEGAEGWLAPPPMRPLVQLFFDYTTSQTQGQHVALEQAEWLREAGAEQIQTVNQVHRVGDGSSEQLRFLRFWVTTLQKVAPVLVGNNLISQSAHDAHMENIFRQLSPQMSGHLTFRCTLARKSA